MIIKPSDSSSSQTLALSLDLTAHTLKNGVSIFCDDDLDVNSGIFQHTKEENTKTTLSEVSLGKGGMGNILLGKQNLPRRDVAVKVLHEDKTHYRQLLLQEANIMGRLNHPNIVPIHQVLIDDNGQIQVIMKQVEGITLKDFLLNHPADGEQFQKGIQILLQVCHALEFAHANFILHRDIKCENIMIGSFNEVYLMDWGLAFDIKLASFVNRGVMGTPNYMAPEMLLGDPMLLDARTDVYLTGATLHYILTREYRHNFGSVLENLEAAERSPPSDYPDDIPEHIANIVNKACAKHPEDRYQTIAAFRKALDDALQIWDAISIIEKAHHQLLTLQKLQEQPNLSKEDINYIHDSFIKILTSYEMALELTNDLDTVLDGLETAHLFMIQFYLSQNNPKAASQLFSKLQHQSIELETKINQQLVEIEKQEKALALAKEHDPLQSKSGRKILMYSLAGGCIALVIFAMVYQQYNGNVITTKRLTFSSFALFIFVVLGSVWGRNSLLLNTVGRELTKTFLLGGFVAFACTFAGYIYDTNSSLIMTIQMFILGITFGNIRTLIKSANKIMLSSFVLAMLSLFFHDSTNVVHSFLLASITIAGLISLLDWYQEE